MLRALFRSLRRCLFLISNTLSCFIHCNSSRFLIFVVEVSSRRRQPSSPKIIQLLSPNPNQLVCFNRKANSKGSAHDERCDCKSDYRCNFHDFIWRGMLPLHRLESRRRRRPLVKISFRFLSVLTALCSRKYAARVVSNHGSGHKWARRPRTLNPNLTE